jgi:hypothetical protein
MRRAGGRWATPLRVGRSPPACERRSSPGWRASPRTPRCSSRPRPSWLVHPASRTSAGRRMGEDEALYALEELWSAAFFGGRRGRPDAYAFAHDQDPGRYIHRGRRCPPPRIPPPRPRNTRRSSCGAGAPRPGPGLSAKLQQRGAGDEAMPSSPLRRHRAYESARKLLGTDMRVPACDSTSRNWAAPRALRDEEAQGHRAMLAAREDGNCLGARRPLASSRPAVPCVGAAKACLRRRWKRRTTARRALAAEGTRQVHPEGPTRRSPAGRAPGSPASSASRSLLPAAWLRSGSPTALEAVGRSARRAPGRPPHSTR